MASMNNIGTGQVNYYKNPPIDAHPVPRKIATEGSEMAMMADSIASASVPESQANLPSFNGFHHQGLPLKNGMVVGPQNSRIEPLHIRVSAQTLASDNFQSTLRAVANNGIQVAVAIGASDLTGSGLLNQVSDALSDINDHRTMESIYGYIQDKARVSGQPGYSHPARMAGD